MKQLLTPANATLVAASKTITFATTIPASISHILHVTNVTRGVLYFQPQAGALFTGTYASPVLTIVADTTGHADADKLEIFYDDGVGIAADATLTGGTARSRITDGTSNVAVKAAATAAVAGDPALVVAISPNNSVAVIGSQGARTQQTFNSTNSGAAIPVTGYNIVTVAFASVSGAGALLSVTFQGSDDGGTTWYNLQGVRTDTSIIESSVSQLSSASVPRAWDIPVGGVTHFRLRNDGIVGTTPSFVFGITPQALPYDPAPVVGLHNVGGTTMTIGGKGVQQTNALPTQDMKDSGRIQVNLVGGGATTATDTLQSMVKTINNVTNATTTTPTVVTSTKTFRVTRMDMYLLAVAATLVGAQVSLRFNTSGLVIAASPLAFTARLGFPSATVAIGEQVAFPISFPEGLEFAAGTGIGVTAFGLNTSWTAAIGATIYVSVSGYEY